jgi:hypothetical protein
MSTPKMVQRVFFFNLISRSWDQVLQTYLLDHFLRFFAQIENFWRSRNLFIKRLLAAGGHRVIDITIVL